MALVDRVQRAADSMDTGPAAVSGSPDPRTLSIKMNGRMLGCAAESLAARQPNSQAR